MTERELDDYFDLSYIPEKFGETQIIFWRLLATPRDGLYRIGITPDHAIMSSSLLWRNQEI